MRKGDGSGSEGGRNGAEEKEEQRRLIREAQEWMEMILGEKFPSSFQDSLLSGLRLCKVVNTIWPNRIRKVRRSMVPANQLENLNSYLVACRGLGIPHQELFRVEDLTEGRDLRKVARNVLALKQVVSSHVPHAKLQRLLYHVASASQGTNQYPEQVLMKSTKKMPSLLKLESTANQIANARGPRSPSISSLSSGSSRSSLFSCDSHITQDSGRISPRFGGPGGTLNIRAVLDDGAHESVKVAHEWSCFKVKSSDVVSLIGSSPSHLSTISSKSEQSTKEGGQHFVKISVQSMASSTSTIEGSSWTEGLRSDKSDRNQDLNDGEPVVLDEDEEMPNVITVRTNDEVDGEWLALETQSADGGEDKVQEQEIWERSLLPDKRERMCLSDQEIEDILDNRLDNMEDRTKLWLHILENEQKALLHSPWKTKRETTQNPKLRRTLLKRLLRTGVPECVRAQVWLLCSGALKRMASQRGYYAQMVQPDRVDKELLKLIDERIAKWRVQHELWLSKDSVEKYDYGLFTAAMKRILVAFHTRNPNQGFCPSHVPIIGHFLTRIGEEASFWLLVQVVEVILPPDYFTTCLSAAVDQFVFMKLLQEHDEELWARLCREKLPLYDNQNQLECCNPVPLVTFNWFMHVFAYPFGLSAEFPARVFDVFFYEGDKSLFRVGLGILTQPHTRTRLLNGSNARDLTRTMEQALLGAQSSFVFNPACFGSLTRARISLLRTNFRLKFMNLICSQNDDFAEHDSSASHCLPSAVGAIAPGSFASISLQEAPMTMWQEEDDHSPKSQPKVAQPKPSGHHHIGLQGSLVYQAKRLMKQRHHRLYMKVANAKSVLKLRKCIFDALLFDSPANELVATTSQSADSGSISECKFEFVGSKEPGDVRDDGFNIQHLPVFELLLEDFAVLPGRCKL